MFDEVDDGFLVADISLLLSFDLPMDSNFWRMFDVEVFLSTSTFCFGGDTSFSAEFSCLSKDILVFSSLPPEL